MCVCELLGEEDCIKINYAGGLYCECKCVFLILREKDGKIPGCK